MYDNLLKAIFYDIKNAAGFASVERTGNSDPEIVSYGYMYYRKASYTGIYFLEICPQTGKMVFLPY